MQPHKQLSEFLLTETEGGAVVYMRFDDAAAEVDVFGCPECSSPERLVELREQGVGTGTFACGVCARQFPIWASDASWDL